MSDYFLTKFYNDVKDSTWPSITTFTEFMQLPEKIRQECFLFHNFQKRLQQIEDEKYWRGQSSHSVGYRCQNVIYVPVFKCANSYYTNLLHKKNGWEPVHLSQVNLAESYLFGLMLHPLSRRIKGIIEVLGRSYKENYNLVLEHLRQPEFSRFLVSITTLDAHTLPYWFLMGNLLEKITWIPMELYSDIDLQKQVEKFINAHGLTVDFPKVVNRMNESSSVKIQCFEELKKIYLDSEPVSELYQMFSKDLELYHRLIVHK